MGIAPHSNKLSFHPPAHCPRLSCRLQCYAHAYEKVHDDEPDWQCFCHAKVRLEHTKPDFGMTEALPVRLIIMHLLEPAVYPHKARTVYNTCRFCPLQYLNIVV